MNVKYVLYIVTFQINFIVKTLGVKLTTETWIYSFYVAFFILLVA
jgi:hypothetical protein